MKSEFTIRQIARKALFSAGVTVLLLGAQTVAISVNSSSAQTASQTSVSGVVHAAERSGRKRRRTPALRNKVYEKIAKAAKLMEEKKYDEAIEDFMRLVNATGRKSGLNSYEKAMVWKNIGFVYYTQEKFPQAIAAFRQVVAQPNIPEAMEIEMKYTIAQLYMAQEDYRKAIPALEEWFAVAQNPGPDAHVLLGQAYLQVKNTNKALFHVEKAMEIAAARGMKPKEHWYLLLRVLYYQKGNKPKTIWALEQLVKGWPQKGEYWIQLAMMYGDSGKEKEQMYALETAWNEGHLKRESQLVLMAQMFAASEMPYKASKVMSEGFRKGQIEKTARNLSFYGDALRRAQEVKDAVPYLEQAAKLEDKASTWLRLAHIYYAIDEYEKSANAARNALKAHKEAVEAEKEKEQLKRPDNAQILLGQALFNAQKWEEARTAFKVARRSDNSKTNKTASQWMEFMKKEMERQRQIAEYLEPS